MSGKLHGRSYAGTLKNFQSTHIGYRAHRAVIFAIAWHLVLLLSMCFLHTVKTRVLHAMKRQYAIHYSTQYSTVTWT